MEETHNMTKIQEVVLEPSKIYTGSSFLLKVKCINYITYKELKNKKTYLQAKDLRYKNLKGEI